MMLIRISTPSPVPTVDLSHPAFPKELILQIFDHLPPRTKVEIELVCKKWRDILRDKQAWMTDLLIYFPALHPAYASPLSGKELFYRYHNNMSFYKGFAADEQPRTLPIQSFENTAVFHASGNELFCYQAANRSLSVYDIFASEVRLTVTIPTIVSGSINGSITHLHADGGRLICGYAIGAAGHQQFRCDLLSVALACFGQTELLDGRLLKIHAKDDRLFAAYTTDETTCKIAMWDINTLSMSAFEYTDEEWGTRIKTLRYDQGMLLIAAEKNLALWDVTNNALRYTWEWEDPVIPQLRGGMLEFFSKNPYKPAPALLSFQFNLLKMKNYFTGQHLRMKSEVDSEDSDNELLKFSSEKMEDTQSYSTLATRHFFNIITVEQLPRLIPYGIKTIQSALPSLNSAVNFDTAVLAGSTLFFLSSDKAQLYSLTFASQSHP